MKVILLIGIVCVTLLHHANMAKGQGAENVSIAGLLQSLPVKYFHQTGPEAGSSNPATELISGGYNPTDLRICADGSAATFLQIKSPNSFCDLGNISIRMKNDSLRYNPDKFGEFKPDHRSISGVTLKWKYSHPVWLSEPDIIFNSRDEIIQVLYYDKVIREINVRFMTTPVLMVHGLWGKPGSFSAMCNYLYQYYCTIEYYQWLLLRNIDYSGINSQSYSDIYRIIPDEISSMQKRLAESGISSGKVDLVAHSMGGLLGRYYFQSSMYRDDVRKIITINTPHAGSPAANFLKSNLEGAEAARATLHMTIGGNVVDGAVDDLMVLPATNNLQTLYQSLSQQQLPSHAIETSDQLFFNDFSNFISMDELLIWEIAFFRMPVNQKMFLMNDSIVFLNSINQSANDFLNSCFGESNDFIVPVSSQDGGLFPDNLTQFNSISHTQAPESQVVHARVCDLLKESPKNTQFFSTDGYDPPYLFFTMTQKTPKIDPFVQDTGCHSLSIIPDTSVFSTGDTMNIYFNSSQSVFYQRIWIRSGNELLVYYDTVGNSTIHMFSIPEGVNGILKIFSMEVDTNNHYCIDSLFVSVNNTIPIDSITVTPDYLYIPMCGTQRINFTGIANDSVKIPICGDTSLFVNVLDTTVAAFHYPNTVSALQPGSTYLQVVYANDTHMVPLSVYNDNLFLMGDSVACEGTAGSEFHLYSSVEGRYYQLLRNDTAIGQPIVCENDVISFGSFQQPGVYSVIEIDSTVLCVNSHSNKINLSASLSPIVDLGEDTAVLYPGSITLDAGTPGLTYLWSTGSTNQFIIVDTAGTYWVQVSNGGWCAVTDTINVGISGPGHSIKGQVTYNNAVSTPLNNSIIVLDQGEFEVSQQVADSLGYFSFDYPMPALYHLETISDKPWGGVNAIDALKIFRHSIQLNPLEALNLLAGDVDKNGIVDSLDAFLCMQRFVDLTDSFPAGNWVFEEPEFNVNTASYINQDIKGLCFGDVNGSYLPAYCLPWPTQPDAGADSLNIPGTTYNLSANIPIVGVGCWSKLGEAWGIFGDSLQAQTTFTGLQGKTYYLIWSISTSCHTLVDTVKIGFLATGPCQGIDSILYGGQSYNTVEIGSQCWMKENLNIGFVINSGSNQQNNGIIEKYCMNNNPSYCDVYGGLYQWDEMMDYSTTEGTKGICPSGWHVPTEEDWCTLTTFLDSTVNCEVFGLSGTDAGGKMKEAGTSHWQAPNTGATNSSGFTALPAGGWNTFGSFPGLFICTYMWTSTEFSGMGTYRTLFFDQMKISRDYYYKSNGNSVRCIRNN